MPAIIAGHELGIVDVDKPEGTVTINNPWDNGDKIYTISKEFVLKYLQPRKYVLNKEIQEKLEAMNTVTKHAMSLGAGSQEEHPTSATAGNSF